MSETGTTQDRFLDGAVSVIQPAKGYRAGMDAVLLAASLQAETGQTLAEAGCGAGTALLCAAYRLAGCAFTGFERADGVIGISSDENEQWWLDLHQALHH